MPLSHAYPTIDEIIASGDLATTGLRRPLYPMLKFLKKTFLDNPVGILLLTDETLPQVGGVARRTETLIKAGLSAHDLRLRKYDEPIGDYAGGLYGSIEAVPLPALLIYVQQLGSYRNTQYSYHPAIEQLLGLNPDMTLGDVSAMNRQEVRKYFEQNGDKLTTHQTNEIVQMLRTRLGVYGLSLRPMPSRSKSKTKAKVS